MATARRIVLHAGLHKTGTTSLQSFLFSATELLRCNGFIYPRSGALEWLGGGHHNIAWELAGDHRRVAQLGTIDDLAREIAASGQSAIISAEDLESIIDEPDRFAPLYDHPELEDYEFTLIFYIRSQASYLESLYLEMLHHGVGAGLADFAEPLSGSGRIVFRDWAFHFDYSAVCARVAASGRMTVIVRNYHRLNGGSVITDFLSRICPNATGPVERERANPRDAVVDSLRMFCCNRGGRELSAAEMGVIRQIAGFIGSRPVGLSANRRRCMATRFDRSNQELSGLVGLEPDGLVGDERTGADIVAMDRLFSPATHDAILTAPMGGLPDEMLEALISPAG